MLTEKHPLDVQILTSYFSFHNKYNDILQKKSFLRSSDSEQKTKLFMYCKTTMPNLFHVHVRILQPLSNQSGKNNKMSLLRYN